MFGVFMFIIPPVTIIPLYLKYDLFWLGVAQAFISIINMLAYAVALWRIKNLIKAQCELKKHFGTSIQTKLNLRVMTINLACLILQVVTQILTAVVWSFRHNNLAVTILTCIEVFSSSIVAVVILAIIMNLQKSEFSSERLISLLINQDSGMHLQFDH